jgi:iron complex transport system ATP-binding protein
MGDFEKQKILWCLLMISAENIVTIDGLRTGYRSGRDEIIILEGLHSTALRGELIAVIGKNGAGKSTLLRTIIGLQPALGGKIFHEGRDILEYSRLELARKVGYISTEAVRATNMNVYDLVSLGRYPYTNWTGRIDRENHIRIIEAIENAGMTSFNSRFISELSDGERQRAMIARILAQDTGLMVMDEPTAFLDIGSKFEILHLLHNLAKTTGKTIIFSTHDLQMAISQADKIWLLKDKKLVEGAPEDLMIQGEFDHIFDSSPARYNSDQGTFTFIGEEQGSIYVEGEGILRHWTEKAVNRNGFAVSREKTDRYIIVPSGNFKNWRFVECQIVKEFPSVYELAGAIKKLAQSSI